MAYLWACLYRIRHQHGSGSRLFLLNSPVVVDWALSWAWPVYHFVLLVLVVCQVGVLIVAQSLVLSGGEVTTDSSDVVESALIRTDSQSTGCWLDRHGIVISFDVSLNRAWSLHIQLP